MKFSKITGQSKVKYQLAEMVNHGRIPHSQLFLGPEGSGALPLAIAFVQYLLCENKQDNDSCGQCPSCNKVSKLIHPDVHFTFPVVPKTSGKVPVSDDYIAEFRKAFLANPFLNEFDFLKIIQAENRQGNITALEARNIIKRLNLKTFESEFKITIIWKPEALGKEGNILLKLLEEPTENTVLILVGENQEEILPTILSRTQLIKVPSLEDDEIAKELEIKGCENVERAQRIAFLSQGNLRAALQLLHHEEAPLDIELSKWLSATLNNHAFELIQFVDQKSGSGRENIKQYLEYVLHFFRECTMMMYCQQLSPRFTESEQILAGRIQRFLSEEKLNKLIPTIEKAHYAIERNCNPKLVLLNLSIQMEKILRGKPVYAEMEI